jgi:hypothetical protein
MQSESFNAVAATSVDSKAKATYAVKSTSFKLDAHEHRPFFGT